MKTKLLVAILALASLSGVLQSHAAERKPNFLFIYTDDQRWNAEFDRQVKATEYHVPAHADQPGSTNVPPAGKKKGKMKKAAAE